MATTEHGTTYYSSADLTREARATAKGHKCPECQREVRAYNWELALGKSHEPCLIVTTKCRHHDYYLTLGCAI